MSPYACNNRAEFKSGQFIEYPGIHDGEIVLVSTYIPFRMRRDCSYTTTNLGQADERCHGCSWRSEKTQENAKKNP